MTDWAETLAKDRVASEKLFSYFRMLAKTEASHAGLAD